MVEKVEQRIIAARELRNESTEAEKLLWEKLRGRQLLGLRFKRQCVIGPLIVDFYCPAAKLVIEVDGDIHDYQKEYDEVREKHLEDHGYRVIRIRNELVLMELNKVLSIIGSVAMRRIAELTSNRSTESQDADLTPIPSPDSRRGAKDQILPDPGEGDTPHHSSRAGG